VQPGDGRHAGICLDPQDVSTPGCEQAPRYSGTAAHIEDALRITLHQIVDE
jgi:hypothetical protein